MTPTETHAIVEKIYRLCQLSGYIAIELAYEANPEKLATLTTELNDLLKVTTEAIAKLEFRT